MSPVIIWLVRSLTERQVMAAGKRGSWPTIQLVR